MSIQDDIRNMIASSAGLCQGPAEVFLVKTSATVQALPGLATLEDTVLGAGTINGTERTLRFSAADVDLKPSDLLIWNAKTWKIKQLQLLGSGSLVKAFLQENLG